MNTNQNFLEPKILGFWTRCIRESQHISQDALAASSGLDVRTIQRIEAGNAVNVQTRRCLARGLGYENQDIFDDPEFAKNVHVFLENVQTINQDAVDKQYPEHIRVNAERVKNGAALGRFTDLANAVMLNADDELSQEAKVMAASLFDYIRDLLDFDIDSYSDKLKFEAELETMLREVEGLGAALYSAVRYVKLIGENWADKTPLRFTIGYLTAVPAGKHLDTMFVPRRVRFG